VWLLKRLDRRHESWDHGQTLTLLDRKKLEVRADGRDRMRLDSACENILLCLQKVQADMLHLTAEASPLISYATVGPQYVMLVGLNNLANRSLLSDMDVVELYQGIVSQLVSWFFIMCSCFCSSDGY
jgi:hypothetical protein